MTLSLRNDVEEFCNIKTLKADALDCSNAISFLAQDISELQRLYFPHKLLKHSINRLQDRQAVSNSEQPSTHDFYYMTVPFNSFS